MSEKLLELKSVKKYYYIRQSFFSREKIEIRAVDGISFSLFSSQATGIVGESGCGKTTVAKLILKLLEPSSGLVCFGPKITNLHKDIQMVFQNPYNSLDPLMRIQDIILEPLLIHKMHSSHEAKGRVRELLKLVELDTDCLSRLPQEFSGGQRQRISLARALATKPKLIVLDEPVSSLDVRIQARILKLLKGLQEKFNLGYMFITHNLGVVKNFCDLCLVMYLGKIMEYATTTILFSRCFHPYTEALLLASREKKSKLTKDIPRFKKITGCIFNTRCLYARERCFKVEPELEEKEKGHFVACHFPLHTDGRK